MPCTTLPGVVPAATASAGPKTVPALVPQSGAGVPAAGKPHGHRLWVA
jgi:hypothetical protein